MPVPVETLQCSISLVSQNGKQVTLQIFERLGKVRINTRVNKLGYTRAYDIEIEDLYDAVSNIIDRTMPQVQKEHWDRLYGNANSSSKSEDEGNKENEVISETSTAFRATNQTVEIDKEPTASTQKSRGTFNARLQSDPKQKANKDTKGVAKGEAETGEDKAKVTGKETVSRRFRVKG